MFEQRDLSFIHKYFIEERQASLFMLVVGVITIILAVIFYCFIKSNPSLYKGAAVLLLAFGLLETIGGYMIYSRSDKQRKDVSYNTGMEPVRYIKTEELPRMKKVMKNFELLKWIEVAVGITGLILIFVYKTNPTKTFWYGFGLALFIEAALLFGFDMMAANRGKIYKASLEKIIAGN